MMTSDTYLFSQYWADEAYFTDERKDKILMYELAARAVEETDKHHASVLKRIANNYREGNE